jgi:hypothetical protein
MGDFSEEARCRGSFWFWLQVLRTAIALYGRILASAPGRIGGLMALGLALLQLVRLSERPLMIALYSTEPRHEMTFFLTTILWPLIVAPLLIGFIIACLSPRREVAACATLALLSELLVLGYLVWAHTTGSPLWRPYYALGMNLIPVSPLLIASAVVRHRRKADSQFTT